MRVTSTPYSCCNQARRVCSASASHWPTVPKPSRARRSDFIGFLSFTRRVAHHRDARGRSCACLPLIGELPISCHMRGSWTSALSERSQAGWLFISQPTQEPGYGSSHRSFHQQHRAGPAGSSTQETLAADIMAPPVSEVEWEEQPTARWSLAG